MKIDGGGFSFFEWFSIRSAITQKNLMASEQEMTTGDKPV